MISQWERKFAHGNLWYLDPSWGDDLNDGKSWQTAKRSWQGILNVAVSGDTIFLNRGLYEDITIPNEKVFKIVGVGKDARIVGTEDLAIPLITSQYGGFWIENMALGGFLGYAERNMVLLENVQKSQGIRNVLIYGGVANAQSGQWVGNPLLKNVEQLTISSFYSATITEVGSDYIKVQGDITNWQGITDKINFSSSLFPIYPTVTYTNIVYEVSTNTSTITGITPPFTETLKPKVNDKVALCAVSVNTDLLTYNHYKGEPVVNDKVNFKSLLDFRTLPFPSFGVFLGCNLYVKIIPNATEGFTPQLSLVFDFCNIANFAPFDSMIYGDFNSPFVPFGFRHCIFYFGNGTRLLTGVADPQSPIKDLLTGGGFYHNYLVEVDFGNFSYMTGIKEWVESQGLVVSKWIDIIGKDLQNIGITGASLDLTFKENMWMQFNLLQALGLFAMGVDLGLDLFEVLPEVRKYPLGNLTETSRDTAPLSFFGGSEVPLVYDIGEKLKEVMKVKRIEVLR